jgi:hypothetical protein
LIDNLIVTRRALVAGISAVWAASARAAALPQTLEAYRGRRPRLFLDADRLEEVRRSAAGTHALLWKQLASQADGMLRQKPPVYRPGGVDRGVGNTIATLAFTYLVSRDRKYFDAACKWARSSCEYPAWELDTKTGKPQEYGLVFGHHLLGLAMLFDYAGPELDPDLRKLIRDTMIARAAMQYNTYSRTLPAGYLCNQTWVNITGMLAAGLALFDEEPAATRWIALVREILSKTMLLLASDGASQEGVGYWEYGIEYLLKLMHLSRKLLGDDYYGHPWFRQTAQYALHMSVPRVSWRRVGSVVDLGDCPRYHWYGPDYQLRALASEYRDGTAQWLASQIDESSTAAPVSAWLNLLWFDPRIQPQPPASLATTRRFENMEIVAARSGWDGNESLVVFKCGPALGFHAAKKFPELVSGNLGHAHPDANHFVFFGHGEWLIRNQGYVQRQTKYHNTLLVNGQGQYDAAGWFDGDAQMRAGRFPRVLRAEFQGDWDWIAGDATEAYRPECGLKRYVRHLIFLKPDILIVADDVELAAPGKLEFLFHTERPGIPQPDGSCLCLGESAALRAVLLTPAGLRLEPGTMPVRARHPDGRPDRVSPVLRLTAESATVETVVAFSCSAANLEPVRVKFRREGPSRIFSFGEKSYSIDFTKALSN